MTIRVKRIYERPEKEDGMRILVDRLWPRGLTKQRAALDLWLKEIAPSTELRKWFGHDPQKAKEFARRYTGELRAHREQLDLIRQKARDGTVTLVFATRDLEHNNALFLKRYLEKNSGSKSAR
jgi:uncharacterized protein YeaO (DUF488 family)